VPAAAEDVGCHLRSRDEHSHLCDISGISPSVLPGMFQFQFQRGLKNIFFVLDNLIVLLPQIITTASTETGIHFIFLIVSTSLLHISMSGYEFRISLFYYLLVLTVIYVTLQWMIHYDWMLSLATLHKMQLISKGFF